MCFSNFQISPQKQLGPLKSIYHMGIKGLRERKYVSITNMAAIHGQSAKTFQNLFLSYSNCLIDWKFGMKHKCRVLPRTFKQ